MKNLLKLMFAASASIALLASCSKDTSVIDPGPGPDPNPNPDPTPVRVELNIQAETYAAVRSIDENSISDVNIYFYSDSKNYHYYYAEAAPTYELQMLPGTYQLFVITNVHRDLGDLTISELQDYDYIAGDMVSDIPMTATTNVTVLGTTTIPTIQVKRAAAKIVYTVSVDNAVASTIKLRSVQFCNLPKSLKLFSSSRVSTDTNDFSNGAIMEIQNDKTFSDAYFLLENCQGTVGTITKPTDKAPENAPACATYIRIMADHVDDGSGKMLEYIVYLGENTTSNFDVRRNTKHTMNLVIRGENEIDNRVTVYDGLYYGKANCYICEGNQVTFDVTAYRTSKGANYAYTGINAGDDYNPVSAKILYSSIKWDLISLSLANNQLTVTADWPENKGQNIVVAIVDGNDEILWSFQIWHPKTTIIDEEYTNLSGEKFMMMDRNLGEMSSGTRSDAHPSNCNHPVYEWGRKDPFWYDDSAFYVDASSPYTKYWKDIVVADKETVVTIDDLHKNPMTFYGDGYTPDENFWGDPNNEMETYGWTSAKSVYDPCPEGYRVPNAKTWTRFSGRYVGSYYYGWSFKRNADDKVGTFYPRGYTTEWKFNGWSVAFGTGVGDTSRYWVSSPQFMYFFGSSASISFKKYADDIAESKDGKNKGNKVRCARVQ